MFADDGTLAPKTILTDFKNIIADSTLFLLHIERCARSRFAKFQSIYRCSADSAIYIFIFQLGFDRTKNNVGPSPFGESRGVTSLRSK